MNRIAAGVLMALTAVFLAAPAGAQKKSDADAMFEAARQKETLEGDLSGAIKQYKAIAEKYKNDRAATAMALARMAECYQKLGDAQSGKIFEQVLSEYGDQKNAVAIARAQLGGGSVRATDVKRIWSGRSESFSLFWRPSPDGRYLAGRHNTGLVLHDISTNADRQLTGGNLAVYDGTVDAECFTPDGKRIVYEWRKGDLHEIRVINVDGTGERTILNSSEYVTLEVSAITADGNTIAVGLERKDDTWQVGLVSIETGKISILKNNDWRDTYVGNFSADGAWLVYSAQVSKDDAKSGAVFAVATDGSAQFTLAPGPAKNDFPFFTPDGSRVVFVANQRPGHTDLWSVRVADGKPLGMPEIAKTDIGDVMGFARDGSFYYRESLLHFGVYVADVDPATWKVKNAPKEISNAFRDKVRVDQPVWSPDGKLLAYLSGLPGPEDQDDVEILLHGFNSTPDRELSFPEKGLVLDGWSLDSKSLVIAGGGKGLRLIDTATQRERVILEPKPQGLGVSAMDGRAAFYYTRDSGPLVQGKILASDTVHLMRHDLQTGEEKELYHTEAWNGTINFLAPSPDGRSLAFGFRPPGGEQSFWLLPLSGGEPYKLPSAGKAVWTQDNKALLFVRPGEIWVQPVDGSEAYSTGIRFTGTGAPKPSSPSLSPDGSRIAFTMTTGNIGQAWAITNLFGQTSAAK